MTSVNPSNANWTLSIDFGTTSTVAAMTFANGTTEVLEVDGERRTPSVVLVDDDGSLVVGAAAVGLASSRPERTIRAPKRRLGEQTPVVLGGKPYNPVDLVASVLRHVLGEAKRHVGSAPDAVRLTHPATWSRPLQQRLLEAAAKAGMTEAELVPEPVAAAMAAADRSLPVGSYIAVYDLGGGTFDTTVVQSTESGYTVVGHPIGDRQIGGELFDEALMNHVGSRLEPAIWERLQVSGERDWHQAASRLLSECRRVKEALSTHGYGEIVVGTPGGMIDERVTRDELEAIVAPYLEASVDLLDRCVDDVGIEPSQLAAIHMIGGASRMPLAASMVEEAFPGVEVSRRGDPRTAVAVGAALVDLSSEQPNVVADQNTTVERRPRSIDAEAAAIDAAAAAKAKPIAPPTNPSLIARPATPASAPPASTPAQQPADPATVAEPAAATTADPGTATPTHVVPETHHGAASPTTNPAPQPAPAGAGQQPPSTQGATPQFFGAATPPPGASSLPASSSPPMPVLLGIGAIALAVIAGLAFAFWPDEGNETAAEVSIQKDTQPAPTIADAGNGGDLITITTPPPDDTTTSSETTTTDSTTTTTAAAATGPTRTDAFELLYEVDEIPGVGGWEQDTYDPEPLEPCGIVAPHTPLFTEGRAFIKNEATPEVVTMAQEVSVYANETEAAAVMDLNQTFSDSCSSDILNLLGTDFNAVFQTCDPFATCDGSFPASAVNLLGGDEYAIQLALLNDPITDFTVTDQIYLMRIGRTIISIEYVVADIATDAQTEDAIAIALDTWARSPNFPR